MNKLLLGLVMVALGANSAAYAQSTASADKHSHDHGTPQAAVAAPQTAKVKFEAPKGRAGKKDEPIALGGEPERKSEKKPAPGPENKEEGMSRLMKAKKRAQDEMQD